jgi:protein TonB
VDRKHRAIKYAPIAGGLVLLLVLVLGMVWLVHNIMASKTQKASRTVQTVTVIRPPPPPPEQPPPPPPPEKIEEPLPQNEPEPAPDNAPPQSEQLGLDAEGSAGDDAFGLAARKGGGDLVGTGNAVFAWYTNKVKDAIVERLASDPKLRGRKYNVPVRIWLEADGRIKSCQLMNSTGDQELDRSISAAFVGLRIAAGPPLELPQPLQYQLNSHT